MRHKYETRGIVLSRSPIGETSASITLLTADVGLVRARAQGLRRSGAKLSAALTTLAESEVTLVRGKESWRVAGAVLVERWFTRLPSAAARLRAARVSGLLLRFVAGESREPALFEIMKGFFEALAVRPESEFDAIEVLAVTRILATLGFDAGRVLGAALVFSPEMISEVEKNRAEYITRINRGITASGL